VRIGVDDDPAAILFGDAEVEVVQVRTCGAGIVFDGYPELRGAFEDCIDVDGVAFATEDLASGGMAEDADVWIFESAEDALCHLFDGLVEEGVNAGDDDVHLGERGVIEIERAVGEDVDLDAGEDTDFPFHFGVDLADGFDVSDGSRVVEAIGHREVFGVVSDGDVFETTGESSFGHLPDGVAAVGGVGVHVEVAADVGEGDELGECVGGRGFDLSGVFA